MPLLVATRKSQREDLYHQENKIWHSGNVLHEHCSTVIEVGVSF